MIKNIARYALLFFCMTHCMNVATVSIVYNFGMAEVTKQSRSAKIAGKNHTPSARFFDQWRKKYTGGIHQSFIGLLGTYIYDFEPYYFRTDAAFAHIKETTKNVPTFCGTETDDILFTGGRNFILNNRSLLTLSGLFGVPTHRVYRLQHVDFGYSQVGLGIQLDGSYNLNEVNSLLYGARYIRFIPKNACDTVGLSHRFTLGNLGDLFFALKNTWNSHDLELGALQRFRFGARVCPNLDNILPKTNYIRTTFYSAYKYNFFINDIPNRLILNVSYGFEEESKIFGNKYIAMVWASWGVSF